MTISTLIGKEVICYHLFSDFVWEDDYNGVRIWWDASNRVITVYTENFEDCIWEVTSEMPCINLEHAREQLDGWLNCGGYGFVWFK